MTSTDRYVQCDQCAAWARINDTGRGLCKRKAPAPMSGPDTTSVAGWSVIPAIVPGGYGCHEGIPKVEREAGYTMPRSRAVASSSVREIPFIAEEE